MTDPAQPALGTVAEEAARLIAAMATMARAGTVSEDTTPGSSPYAGEPAREPAASGETLGPDAGRPGPARDQPGPTRGEPWPTREKPYPTEETPGQPDAERPRADRPCSACGGDSDGTPVACKLCPLCQGIALLRSVRPETVDRLADLASAIAASLRDMATQSRATGSAHGSAQGPANGSAHGSAWGAGPGSASGSASGARPGSGRPSDRGRSTVQDIPVDDETEG